MKTITKQQCLDLYGIDIDKVTKRDDFVLFNKNADDDPDGQIPSPTMIRCQVGFAPWSPR